jgi:indole-3-glycerol phosphate synthase
MSILEDIAAYKRAEVEAAKTAQPLPAVARAAREAPAPRGFRASLANAISAGRPALVAEIKKASPSKGLIRAQFEPASAAMDYEAGGATCLSVLTDGPSFRGAPEHLVEARAAAALPVLRKDFILDPYQVVQSRVIGADCILIILALVSDDLASVLISTARDWGMDALVEVHDEAETARAVDLGADLIGINNRDLRTFVTTLETAIRLKPMIPGGRLVVAESGLSTAADLRKLASAGIRAYLIGEALMRCDDVRQATRDLLAGWQP